MSSPVEITLFCKRMADGACRVLGALEYVAPVCLCVLYMKRPAARDGAFSDNSMIPLPRALGPDSMAFSSHVIR